MSVDNNAGDDVELVVGVAKKSIPRTSVEKVLEPAPVPPEKNIAPNLDKAFAKIEIIERKIIVIENSIFNLIADIKFVKDNHGEVINTINANVAFIRGKLEGRELSTLAQERRLELNDARDSTAVNLGVSRNTAILVAVVSAGISGFVALMAIFLR